MIDYDIENELTPILASGEKLVWTGRPKTGILFRTSDLLLVPFSLIWGGFAFFWEASVIATSAPLLFKLFGLPFVVMGLYLIVGRFFVDAKRREQTRYGITKDRIIIRSGILNKEFKSMNIKTISDISYSQRSDGSGTITFGPQDARYAMMRGMDWPGTKQSPGLELIPDVTTVYSILTALQRQS